VFFFSQKPAASGSAFAAFLAAYRRQKLTPYASGVELVFPQNSLKNRKFCKKKSVQFKRIKRTFRLPVVSLTNSC